MGRLTWYARRLRSMSPYEIVWRASRITSGAARKLTHHGAPSDAALLGSRDPRWDDLLAAFRCGEGRPVLLDRARAARLAAAHPEQTAAVIAAADRVLKLRFGFFGYPEQTLAAPLDWHHDPISATTWPAIPSERIDHRTGAGDAKWIWELNRLQHLPWLAQAWLFTGDDRYADGAFDQLDSWLEQNPPGIGIAWRGAFEAGIRAISVAVAVAGLRESAALTPDRYRRVVRMLADSAERCWQERSRFSSANNHLVGELAGLATVALLFPELGQAPRWERRALAALRVEAQRQILPDGAGAEQAVGYQVFTAELLLVVVALLRLRGDRPPEELVAALERSAGYLAAVIGSGDPAPRYGDDDEGFALRLDAAPLREIPDHLAAVGAVTGSPAARQAARPGLAAGWLAAAGHGEPPAPPPAAGPASRYAPDGGLVVLRSGSRRLTMDVGPLGYLSIAAHGHADALAVTLSVEGQELIGDPGAASYYGHPEWRRVHRGTRAHATVCVDDADQSVIAGPFLWSSHAGVTVRGVDLSRGVVDAEHDGYRRLDPPAGHRRWLIAPPEDAALLVVDLVSGAGTHRVRTSWPLHPALDATRTPDGHLARRDGAPVLCLTYAASAETTHYEVRGDQDTNLGWWSHRLESREPAWLVGTTAEAQAPVVLATVLTPFGAAGVSGVAADLAVSRTGDSIEVTWRVGDLHRRVGIDAAADASVILGDR
ncbi:MAG TPA: alginate lyase family protein [Pseudonocardiaceae bacterium]